MATGSEGTGGERRVEKSIQPEELSLKNSHGQVENL